MAVKLPGFDASVGTAAQPAPNCWPEDIAGAIDGAAIDGAAAGAAACSIGPEPPLPHADRARANTAPAVTVTNRECAHGRSLSGRKNGAEKRWADELN